MYRVAGICLAVLMGVSGWAMGQDDDFVMGNYQGEFTSSGWQNRSIRAEVAAMSVIRYRAVFYIGAEGTEEQRIEITRGRKRGGDSEETPKDLEEMRRKAVIDFDGVLDLGPAFGGKHTLSGTIERETFTGVFKGASGEGAFTLKRVFIEPPTLGQAPPEGAIVLLDGTNLDAWAPCPHWRIQSGGGLQVQGADIHTLQQFGDAQYHLEFKCPFMPSATGQARGNSGVYVMGRYEVQVLDSFADLPMDNLCGGIYKQAKPVVCASLPPLQWQTYDITFRAPRFDASGAKTQNAVITVVHNGITIHDNVELTDRTPGGYPGDEAATGPLLLQDHGDKVQFRNIWVKPLD